jgi:hypothetical protein
MVKVSVCYENIDVITMMLDKQAQEANDENLEFIYNGVKFFANGVEIDDNGIVFTTECEDVIAEINCGTDDSPLKNRVFFTFENGLIYVDIEKSLFNIGNFIR